MNIILWNKTILNHSQGNSLGLYVYESNNTVELYITIEKKGLIELLVHDILIGSMSNIYLNQLKEKIDWQKMSYDFSNRECRFEWVKDDVKPYKHLDYLKYHIANSIREVINDEDYFADLKKKIIGSWKCGDQIINFDQNGKFRSTGQSLVNQFLDSIYSSGTYYLNTNYLTIMKGMHGKKKLIVDLDKNELKFPGENGELTLVLTRIS